jgi:hypothetical protein
VLSSEKNVHCTVYRISFFSLLQILERTLLVWVLETDQYYLGLLQELQNTRVPFYVLHNYQRNYEMRLFPFANYPTHLLCELRYIIYNYDDSGFHHKNSEKENRAPSFF